VARFTQLSWAFGAALFLSGCAIHHEMARTTPAGWCPDRVGSQDWRFSPPGVDRSEAPPITWYSHPSPEDQESNGAWCETLGPPTVLPQPHGNLLSIATDTITFGTWNVWVGGGDLENFLAAELALACDADGPRPLPGFKPFVLLLQEAHQRSTLVPKVPKDAPIPWRTGPEARASDALDVVGVAKSCGLALAYMPSSRNGWESDGAWGEDKGNAILSSLPLKDVVAIELPFEAGRKVAVGAEVRLPLDPGGPQGAKSHLEISVVSVHLDVASTLARTLTTGNRTRERQTEGLLKALELHGWATGPSVVGGDFNTWSSRDAALKAMIRSYPQSPPITSQTTRGPFPTDHVLFRAGPEGVLSLVPSSYRVLKDPYGSDHQARLLRISVGGG
jgi:endonuclease/exonuclease/phosphatase family metal-dependent hydrolase